MLSHMILPAALLIQIIIYSYVQAFSLSHRLNLFAPLTESKEIRRFGLTKYVEKHKRGHAEKVKAGPVPFLPFSSSSSVLLQLSVEP